VKNSVFEADEVITALYEAMLQRRPDSGGLRHYADGLLHGLSLTEVLGQFLASEEFRRRFMPALPSRFLLDSAPPNATQVKFTAEERRALWNHVSEVWSAYGKSDPFWSVLTDERWRSKNLTNGQILDAFYETGGSEVLRLDAWLRRNGLESRGAVCAEYGCGVGRITHALARRFRRVVAFDISEPHLDAARRRLSEQGVENIEYVAVRNEAALDRLRGVDLFYSILVLQHNPPPIMADILMSAFSGLKPGGIAFFQIPTYALNYSFSTADYWNAVAKEKTMEMHFLPQKFVLELGRREGVYPVEIQPDWCIGHPDEWISTTFLMQKCQPKHRWAGAALGRLKPIFKQSALVRSRAVMGAFGRLDTPAQVSAVSDPPASDPAASQIGLRTDRDVVSALYEGLVGRAADVDGLNHNVEALRSGLPLSTVIRSMVHSEEFKAKAIELVFPPADLPDLTKIMPQHYRVEQADHGACTVFHAESDDDISKMERMIDEYRYYDNLGVWNPRIDLDKRVTASIVRGLGARSCLELGCFTGPVLSVLKDAGLEVAGTEVSHLAFVMAYPNIRTKMIYGDLLSLRLEQQFDVIIGMDVLEHISPLKLGFYFECLAKMIPKSGYVFINSPMFGEDDVFGTVFSPYLEEWRRVGAAGFWRDFDCSPTGWPLHGHLVWASAEWWERIANGCGLVRDRIVEAAIQAELSEFFKHLAPARKSLFVLRHADSPRDPCEVALSIKATLRQIEGLPRA
jgi:2-polyprenyl-3-methyl-5-hydroxy-6-metoxy-1,4-benzoquinol methylase